MGALRMDRPFPDIKYLIPGGAIVLTTAGFVCQQLLQSQEWWAKMPWLELLVLCTVFFIGTAYADVSNKNSGLRGWWSDRRRVFEVEFHPSSYLEEGVGHFFKPRFAIRCKRYAKDVRVAVFVHQSFTLKRETPQFEVNRIETRTYEVDQTASIFVASIPDKNVSGRHTFWGEQDKWDHSGKMPNRTITSGGGPHLIELRVTKGEKLIQSSRILFSMVEQTMCGGLFYYVEESDAFGKR